MAHTEGINIKIYFWLIFIAAISLGFTFSAPIDAVLKGVLSLPSVAAMCGVIFQLIRDNTAHERAKDLLQKEQQLSLVASSHMANAVFDKQVEFADKYVSEVLNAFRTLQSKSNWDDAYGFARNLTFLRLEYMCWLTSESDEKLEKFEANLRKLGANSSYLNMTVSEYSGDVAYRESVAKEMLELQAAFLILNEKTDSHHDIKLASLSKKMRELLNVEELTTLKAALIHSSIKQNS